VAEDSFPIEFTDWQWTLVSAALARMASEWREAAEGFPDAKNAPIYRESAEKADYMITKINQAKQEKNDG